jgi:hypothetical protein
VLSYVGYRSAGGNGSGWLENFDGTIYARYATEAGDKGLDSMFGEGTGGGGAAAAGEGIASVVGGDDTTAVVGSPAAAAAAAARAGNASSAFGGDRVLIRPDDFNVNGPWPHQCTVLFPL